MRRLTNPKKFLSQEELAAVNASVKEAERHTSAEIKVVMVRHCWSDIKSRAAKIFKKMGLDKTEQRNCVMLMFVVTNREFLIYGDQGIHEKVGQGFWDDVSNQMQSDFRQNNFAGGISNAVILTGKKLAEYFPYERDDIDEISNEVVFV